LVAQQELYFDRLLHWFGSFATPVKISM
jgi:hypothetical protein